MSKKIIIRIPRNIRIGNNNDNDTSSRIGSDDNDTSRIGSDDNDKSRIGSDDNDKSRIRQSRTSDRVKELVGDFATEHSTYSCKMFKESWNKWIHSGEIDSLLNQSYNNNRDEIENKLYFSARYYHRKKTIKAQKDDTMSQSDTTIHSQSDTTSQSQDDIQKPRPYNKTNRSILQLIDDHLANLPSDNTGYRVKPSLAFDQFTALNDGCAEYKKTYKNRFYMKEKHIISAGK